MAPPTKSSIMTGSGRYFDPLNPTVESVHLPDVARGLRRGVGARFNGQTIDPAACPSPQSGASHSVRIARLTYWRLRSAGIELATVDELRKLAIHVLAALLHDAPEGYLGDPLGPIKTEAQDRMHTEVLHCIACKLVGSEIGTTVAALVDAMGDESKPSILRWADRISLYQEALLYQPGAVDWALPVDGLIRDDIAATLHMFHPREDEDWETAVEVIVGQLQSLTHIAGEAVVDQNRRLWVVQQIESAIRFTE